MVDELKEPTQEWVETAKKKYVKVFRCVVGGEVYIYRFLKRSEFRDLQKTVVPENTPNGPIVNSEQTLELEEKICNMCVLWPEDFAKQDNPATLASVLASYISDSSGAQIQEIPQAL